MIAPGSAAGIGEVGLNNLLNRYGISFGGMGGMGSFTPGGLPWGLGYSPSMNNIWQQGQQAQQNQTTAPTAQGIDPRLLAGAITGR